MDSVKHFRFILLKSWLIFFLKAKYGFSNDLTFILCILLDLHEVNILKRKKKKAIKQHTEFVPHQQW